MYRVILSNRAKKDLKKLDKRYLLKVSNFIDILQTNPFIGKKMEGEFKNSYKIKIPPIRMIYTPNFENKVILVDTIGHRGDIYKSL
jgi:addiction module RelE/StbE family toxin